MPSKTLKATKTLNLGTVSTTLTPYRLKKLTVRTPGRDDRQDYPKDGSILAAVLVAEAEDRKIKGAKTVTGTVVNLRLSMPAALGLLRGLLAVVHPLEIAGDKETSDALKHAQETIDEATADVKSMVEAALEVTQSLETVPAAMDPDPESDLPDVELPGSDLPDVETPPVFGGKPLIDVLTEGEECPDPTQAQKTPPSDTQDSSLQEPALSESPASEGCCEEAKPPQGYPYTSHEMN